MNILEQIETARDQILKARPSYQPMIEFYSQVFMAREQSKRDIDLPLIRIDPDLLKLKQKNRLPLIDPSEFFIDPVQAGLLLVRLLDLAMELAPGLAQSAGRLKQALLKKTLEPAPLFSAILNNQDSTLEALSRQLDIPVSDLVFFAYGSMAPSLQLCSQQLEPYLDQMDQTDQMESRYCPVCGNLPDIAFLDQAGARHLTCTFCSHQWQVKRMGCVFCKNRDNQHYFFSDQEKEYRVDLCDDCHSYIKVVDLREMDRSFYPGLELVSTLHLDMKAMEKGYRHETHP